MADFNSVKRKRTPPKSTSGNVVFLGSDNSHVIRRSVGAPQTWKKSIAILLIALIVVTSFSVSGSSLNYFPQTCDGTWKRPENATGPVDVPFGKSSVDAFGQGNSAVFFGGAETITCSQFSGQSIPEDASLSEVRILLSLAVKFAAPAETKTNVEPPAVPTGEVLGDKTSEPEFIVVEPPAEPIPQPEPAPVPEAIPSPAPQLPVSPSSAAPEATKEPTEPAPVPPAESSEPSGWRIPLISIARGQEQSTGETTPTPQAVVTTEPIPEIVPAESTTEVVQGEPEQTPLQPAVEGTSVLVPTSDAFATVFYSLDGVDPSRQGEAEADWQALGKITADNWEDLWFRIPVGEGGVSTVGELANIQVRIDAEVFTLGEAVELYLDGVAVEISVDEFVPEEESLADKIAKVLPDFQDDAITQVAKKTFALMREVIPTDEVLPWQTLDYQVEHEERSGKVRRSVATFDSQNGAIEVSGTCQKDYFTVLVFRNESDYAKNPSSALFNSAYPCENDSYSYSLDPNTLNLELGTYYLLVADQPESGPWVPVSGLMPFTVE